MTNDNLNKLKESLAAQNKEIVAEMYGKNVAVLTETAFHHGFDAAVTAMQEIKPEPSGANGAEITNEELLNKGMCPCGAESSLGCSVTGCPLYIQGGEK